MSNNKEYLKQYYQKNKEKLKTLGSIIQELLRSYNNITKIFLPIITVLLQKVNVNILEGLNLKNY